jgi:Tol biopolymer transport system component
MVLTSTRSGDIDLYSCKLDGTDPKRLTKEEGYDGGAFFSLDGKQIVYRASRPQGEELKEYKELLKQGLIRPKSLEIMVMDADGSNKKQVTTNGKANFAPFFFPNGKRIIFASNMDDPKGREFDLYAIDTDGKNLERITYADGFDGFPMFTKDGKHLVFCSNRNGSHPGNTNIFIADWVN